MNKKIQRSGDAIRPLLHRIGLDPKEIEVYLALLAMKSGRVSMIAKAAKQSRSHTYLVLQSLEEKGLVSHIEQGKVLKFIAESPEHLLGYLEDQERKWSTLKQLAEGALPQLKSLSQGIVDVPRVTLLKGMDGMKQVYREILRYDFCGLFNAERADEVFGGNMAHMLFGPNVELRAKDLLVDNAGAKKWLSEVKQHEDYEVRLLPKQMQFSTDTVLFGESIALFAYDADGTIVRIENKNIADTFRSWFDALWASAKKTKKT